MGSTTALWFHIVGTFAEVDELCTEALAAELSTQRARDEERVIRTVGQQGRGFGGGGPAADSAQSLEERRYPRAAELVKDLAFREAHPNGADLVKLRDGVRKSLVSLKKELGQVLTDHEVYYVLIPMVIYCDELVLAVTKGAVTRWEPLQSELFNIENGGELFYWSMEERLRQLETHPLVFEVFYFCLNDGFMGMHSADPRKIDEYKDRLRKRIPVLPTGNPKSKETKAPQILSFPWRYYAVSVGVVVAVYLALTWLASYVASPA
jgi:type IV/VI secretion system ImpK/VasF family protein